MNQKTFLLLYSQNLSPIEIIFDTNLSISNVNNIHKVQDISRKFTELECTQRDKKTGRQTNRMHKHFSTMLKCVQNNGTQSKVLFKSLAY